MKGFLKREKVGTLPQISPQKCLLFSRKVPGMLEYRVALLGRRETVVDRVGEIRQVPVSK